MTSRRLRIALAPIEVAGYHANLARGFRELGVECDQLLIRPHAFRYGGPRPDSRVGRALLRAIQRSYTRSVDGPGARVAQPLNLVLRAVLAAHAVRNYDVFVFTLGTTFLRTLELPLLRALGKRCVFVFHGGDSRPPYLNGKTLRACGSNPGPALIAEARVIRPRVDRITPCAEFVVDNPLSGHFQSRPFVNWFRLGIPIAPQDRLDALRAQARPRPAGRLVVVHAPSDPASKGTPLIRAALERARQRGHALELVELMGRPNVEVLRELARCDFVVDELYSDVPGAGLAFEAAAFGKPTIVGGYGAQEFARWIDPERVVPTHYCHPAQLDEAIERLCNERDYRLELGARAQAFVQQAYAPAQVAGRYLQLLEGREVADWFVDPQQIRYTHGTGLTEDAARGAIRAVLDAGSERALCLDDKPQLRRELVTFARGLDA